jgi:hypothetical protein
MLSENWASRAAADAEAPSSNAGEAAAPPAFNPAAPEYNVSNETSPLRLLAKAVSCSAEEAVVQQLMQAGTCCDADSSFVPKLHQPTYTSHGNILQ